MRPSPAPVPDVTGNRADADKTLLPRLDAIDGSELKISFEFFPPKTEKMEATLWESARKLAPIGPRFFSVTYGAGGSTREKTHATVTRLQREIGVPTAAHLTCVEHTREDIAEIADTYWEEGIRHIVALRGDPPTGAGTEYAPTPGGYAYADDLVKGLKDRHDFEISVSAYPEVHPQAPNAAFDLDHLKRKVDNGATRAITQFFFDTDTYLRFLDAVDRAGITVPIVPGILPVSNFAKAVQFAGLCGAVIPDWVSERFDGLDDDPATRNLVATTLAVEICRTLYGHGVREFHFYTLNRADLNLGICRMLGLKTPTGELPAVAAA